MITGFIKMKRFLFYDESTTYGIIETDMGEDGVKKLIKEGNFKYKKEVVAAIKDEGYYAF
jgi:hypothetical protein